MFPHRGITEEGLRLVMRLHKPYHPMYKAAYAVICHDDDSAMTALSVLGTDGAIRARHSLSLVFVGAIQRDLVKTARLTLTSHLATALDGQLDNYERFQSVVEKRDPAFVDLAKQLASESDDPRSLICFAVEHDNEAVRKHILGL